MKIQLSQLTNVSEKISEFLKNAGNRTKYMIFGGILLFIFLLDYFLIMSPQLSTLVKVSTKISTLAADIERTKNDMIRLPQYKTDIEKLKNELALLEQSIQPKEAVPIILERISQQAIADGVKVDQITPGQNQEMLLEKDGKQYFSLLISMEARCGYHNFGRFINHLENDSIVFWPDNILMTNVGEQRTNLVKLTLQTIIYSLKAR